MFFGKIVRKSNIYILIPRQINNSVVPSKLISEIQPLGIKKGKIYGRGRILLKAKCRVQFNVFQNTKESKEVVV